MQTDIKYKIEFFTDWHCSSGLAAGSDVDLLVIKDRNNLPYVPGKTIKGLVKEAIEELILCKACYVNDNTIASLKNTVLGAGTNEQQRKDEYNNIPIKGTSYFTNAELSTSIKTTIIKEELSSYLYRSISSTAINSDGVAKEHSLRKIQTTSPCELYGEIHDIDIQFTHIIIDALRSIKRLGYNRNRGLGRCKFTILEGGNI